MNNSPKRNISDEKYYQMIFFKNLLSFRKVTALNVPESTTALIPLGKTFSTCTYPLYGKIKRATTVFWQLTIKWLGID